MTITKHLTRRCSLLPLFLGLLFIAASCGSGSEAQKNDGEALENALLWKVAHGDNQPSYLFGTLHIMKSGYLDNWSKVKSAYEESEKVIVETVIDSSKMMQLGQMMAMKGNILRDYVDSNEYEQIKNYASGKVQYRMSTLERFKPMQIMMMLAMAEYRKISSPLQKAEGIEVDQYFARNAKEAGKEVIPLEDMLEQGELLYNKKSNSEQADMLVNYVEEAKSMEETARSLIKAYRNQNLNKFKTLYEKDQELLKGMAYLVDDRNQNWIKTAKTEFEEGGTFMAVGAMHLPGEKGLIRLLREAGFEVTPMEVK